MAVVGRITDKELREAVAFAREVMLEHKSGIAHIDLPGCSVWLDEKGYTVIDRYGRGRDVRYTYEGKEAADEDSGCADS